MALKKFVVGCFEDEKVLFPAVEKVRKACPAALASEVPRKRSIES